MGGTSFDASLVQDGAAALNPRETSTGCASRFPMLAITTIGAGGGSIGWVDEGGLLRMGPAIRGRAPRPGVLRPRRRAADVHGRGPGARLPGPASSSPAASCPSTPSGRAGPSRRHIAGRWASTVEEAAAGMYRVINANMAHGVREITVKRGLDPREFPMVVAGGAGPLHACMIASELEIPLLVVPPTASILCAAGHAAERPAARLRALMRDHAARRPGLGPALERWHRDHDRGGRCAAATEGIPEERVRHEVALDLRYLKQYHEVTVPVAGAVLEAATATRSIARRSTPSTTICTATTSPKRRDTGLELINVRVRSVGPHREARSRGCRAGGRTRRGLKGTRRAFVPEERAFADVAVYDGHRLAAGNRIAGPALIERTDTTIFVSAGFTATAMNYGSLPDPRQRDSWEVTTMSENHQDRQGPGGHHRQRLKAITDEMSLTMEKTTRSPILCEAKDFVTGSLRRRGAHARADREPADPELLA